MCISRIASNRRIPDNHRDMAPPSPRRRPRSPPALMEELFEEILLRILPADPAHLFRTALACKPWSRIVSDPGFLRRYRALHRAPPLLGYFRILPNLGPFPQFVSTVAVSPVSPPLTLDSRSVLCGWLPHAHDCRHGCVLIQVTYGELMVWDPITGDQKHLSLPKFWHTYMTGAVLCAVDGCDHLDCHAGAFHVVFCGGGFAGNQHKAWVTMYSSETEVWSSMISIDVDCEVDSRPALVIGNALYFTLHCGVSLVKYDLCGHGVSVIESPCVFGSVAMELDDGELGFVAVLDHCIYMWSWLADANNGNGRWEQHMVMELEALLSRSDEKWVEVIGLIVGTYTIFIGHEAGVFTLDIKSRKVKKVGEKEHINYRILPYMSFYTSGLV